MDLIQQLILHEGIRLKPYRCPAGKLTIGIGRNLDDKGITDQEALMLLISDIRECEEDLRTIFPQWDRMDRIRQNVLIDMRLNLGPVGFRSFRLMIAAVRVNDYRHAAYEMVHSDWFGQVGERGKRLYRMMQTGKEENHA